MAERHNVDTGPAEQDQREIGGTSDVALVERFVTTDDAIAFEILVRRHGPMVLGVCRRLLRHEQDAEDAFQAAFLVLHRKAHSIRATSRLANWLYGVAYRTALKAKSARHSMRTREMQVESLPEPQTPIPDECWRGLEPLLDQELSKLPEKYRLPIVLCELEGMSLKEAARHLNWPEGTVSARLSRGRSLLRDRLSRHGLPLSLAALTAGLAHHAVAELPAALLDSTIHGATLLASGHAGVAGVCSANVAALTKGVLKSMFLAKLKFVAATAVVTTMIGTGAIIAAQDPAGSTGGEAIAQAPAEQPTENTLVPPANAVVVPQDADGQDPGGEVNEIPLSRVIIKHAPGDYTVLVDGERRGDATIHLVGYLRAPETPTEEASSDDPEPEATPFRGPIRMEGVTEAQKREFLKQLAKVERAAQEEQNERESGFQPEQTIQVAEEQAQAEQAAVEDSGASESDDE